MELPDYLISFNNSLLEFQKSFPKTKWSDEFKQNLINDFTFYSSRIEDPNLAYGDTIRFLNNETIRGNNLKSLLSVSEHQFVLKSVLNFIDDFQLNEETILGIHASLLASPLAWDIESDVDLAGKFRNFPVVGSREPLYENKEYAPHYNLEIIMSSWLEIFHNSFLEIDNLDEEKHILTKIAFFHNRFLNEIHPFADGNGRVCRIVIGALLMKHSCPPVFPIVTNQDDQIKYISTIVECEKIKSDKPMVEYLATGITEYLHIKIHSLKSLN